MEILKNMIFPEARFGTQTYQKMSGIENYLKTINTDHYKRGEHPESISYTKRIFLGKGISRIRLKPQCVYCN